MNKIIGILVFSLFVQVNIAQAQLQVELQKLLDNYTASINDLDIELAEKIWATDADVSFIQPRGHQKGWDNIRDNFYLGAMANFKTRELKLKDISIRVLSDDAAWADFYWDFEATFNDGRPLQSSGRESQVWKREADGWKIVHIHYSGMPVTGEREGF